MTERRGEARRRRAARRLLPASALLTALLALAGPSAAATLPRVPVLDRSFGTAGATVIPFPVPAGSADAHSARGFQVAVQPWDQKVLVAGTAWGAVGGYSRVGEFCVARLDANGILDLSFGSGGIACALPQAGAYQYPQSVALDPTTHAILVAGSSSVGGDLHVALVRFTAQGTLDAGFGSGGVLIGPVAGALQVSAVVQDPGGRIVVAYMPFSMPPPALLTFAATAYTSAGSLDTTFGTGGTTPLALTTPSMGVPAELNPSRVPIVAEPDGSLVIAGTTSAGATTSIALQHLTVQGAIDTSFGAGGIASLPSDGTEYPDAAALQGTNVIVSGSSLRSSGNTWGVRARFLSSGVLDSTFAQRGKSLIPPSLGAGGIQANLWGGPVFVDADNGIETANESASGTQVCVSDASGGRLGCPIAVKTATLGGAGAAGSCPDASSCRLFISGAENSQATIERVDLMPASLAAYCTVITGPLPARCRYDMRIRIVAPPTIRSQQIIQLRFLVHNNGPGPSTVPKGHILAFVFHGGIAVWVRRHHKRVLRRVLDQGGTLGFAGDPLAANHTYTASLLWTVTPTQLSIVTKRLRRYRDVIGGPFIFLVASVHGGASVFCRRTETRCANNTATTIIRIVP